MDGSEAICLSTGSPEEPPALSTADLRHGILAIEETYERPDSAGVCVAGGFGVRVRVERGSLEVHDGLGPYRRTRRFEKATHGLRRLVLSDADGFVTLSALRWCSGLGIGVVVLGPDGTASFASMPRMTDDARIRRTQALALERPYGRDIACWLLSRKLAGQGALVLRRFGEAEVVETIGELAMAVEEAHSIEEARGIEASAAALYFGTWTKRPETSPRFGASDRRRIPAHWSVFEGRRSVLGSANGNRKAERPVNALLNYCYGLLEAEATFACQAMGLDPGLGIVHNDARARSSMALDLLEPVRPEVEAFVLDMVERRTFRKGEFAETSDGHVRLLAPLTHEVAEMMPTWGRSLAPIAEHVAHVLGAAMAGKYEPATPLTRGRTRAAQALVKARKASTSRAGASSTVRQRARTRVASSWSCPDCGGAVTNPRHVRCEACIGADPRQSAELRGRRGAAISSRKRALREAEVAGLPLGCDAAWYREVVLPRLASMKLAVIMEVASCSKSYASELRRGRFNPHVSTWRALARLVGVEIDTAATDPSSRGEDQ